MVNRLVIIGLGSIGSRHARLARRLLPRAEIAALTRKNRSECPAEIDHCFETMAQVLEFRPDAAVVANPSSAHLDVAVPLARAGVHLLIEKPIASTMDGVAELIGLCKRQGTVLMVGYNLRFLASLTSLRKLVRERRVGNVLSVHAEVGQYLPSWRPGTDYRSAVSAQAALGGGVLLELSHEIDYLRWIFGDVVWVSAVVCRQSALEIDVEDTAHITLAFNAEPGARAPMASLNMDLTRHDATRNCTVIGETGTLRWQAAPGTVEIYEPNAGAWRLLLAEPGERDDSYSVEWTHFLECVAGRHEAAVSGVDGLEALTIVSAAKRSSAEGRVVPVHGEFSTGTGH